MDIGGGLMVAGDHAAGFCDVGNPQKFGVHGRSLGEPMRRARQLRVWFGPPTACTDQPLAQRDNFNTCEGDDPEVLDDIESQSDASATSLLPLSSAPHPLFWWKRDDAGNIIPIEKFPDHPHESKLLELDELDDEWPSDFPLPKVAAKARTGDFLLKKGTMCLSSLMMVSLRVWGAWW